jgi:hypothetical protein
MATSAPIVQAAAIANGCSRSMNFASVAARSSAEPAVAANRASIRRP